jgi:hypothetical protein
VRRFIDIIKMEKYQDWSDCKSLEKEPFEIWVNLKKPNASHYGFSSNESG